LSGIGRQKKVAQGEAWASTAPDRTQGSIVKDKQAREVDEWRYFRLCQDDGAMAFRDEETARHQG